jgi:glycosyltransferase involved in cell wall biosynthesis
VFLGRLSAEKGLAELLARWPVGLPLDVIGSGGQEADLRASCADRPEVRFLGALSNVEVRTRLGGYTGLVVPSLWAEAGPPLTYVEALAAGVPVVAVEGNGAADDIARHGTGVVVGRDEDPAVALKDVARDRTRLSPRARAVYEQHFSSGAWVTALTNVYREAARG